MSSSLSKRSKSSSKSERDLDCVVSSDWFEPDLAGSGAARVEVVLKMDTSRSPRQDSGVQLVEVVDELVGVAASSWCTGLRLPRVATQIQELKMKVVPSSSTALVKLKDAIEFFGGCSMNTPTWRASCCYFTATPTEGYPRGGEFVGGCRRDQELKGARNIKFR
jgi:hypothetical protein